MKKLKNVIACLIISSTIKYQSTATPTPTDGKFFFLQLNPENSNGYHGLHYTDFQVGSQNQTLPLWISTAEHSIGIFSDKCQNCQVPTKFRASQSTSLKQNVFNSYQTEWVSIFDESDHENVQWSKFNGNCISDTFQSQIVSYDRVVSFDSIALDIDSSKETFKSQFSGYFGIAPYFGQPADQQGRNFLKKLKDNGYIDHQIVSLYNRHDNGFSVIKIGGYDKVAIQDINQLNIFKTNSTKSWALKTNKVDYAQNMVLEEERNFLIEPQLPYLYVPEDDWLPIAQALQNLYGINDITCTAGNTQGYCKFTKPCDQVDKKGLQMKVTIHGLDSSSLFIIDQQDLLISGKYLGQSENTCFVAIFRSIGFEDNFSWYVGNLFLQNYYVFFDMTPADEHGQDYLQIGIAPINKVFNAALEKQYNPNASITRYDPQTGDISRSISGKDQKTTDTSTDHPSNSSTSNSSSNTNTTTNSSGTEQIKDVNNQNVPDHHEKEFFEGKELMLVVISSIVFTVILLVIVCLCCLKKKRKENVEVKGSWLVPKSEDTLKLNFGDTHEPLGIDEEDERRNHIQ